MGPRAEQRERTREAILAAAWEIAHEEGIAEISLRELASRVGMRAPSLYTHFDSKAAILDAMFLEGHEAMVARFADLDLSAGPEEGLTITAMAWVDFSLEDVARHQLLNTHVIAGWEPSTDAYAAAIATYDLMRAQMAGWGVTRQEDLDLWTAMVSGLVSQQIANEPTTRRWVDLVPRLVRMFLADLGQQTLQASAHHQGDER